MGVLNVIPDVRAVKNFSPGEIPGLTGWYDFSDVSTLFQDTAFATPVTTDAQAIGSMRDKSGGNRHLVRGGGAGTEPTYKQNIQAGRSIGRFDGGDWLLNSGYGVADTAQTVIICLKNPGASTLYGPWSRSDSTVSRLCGLLNNTTNDVGMGAGTGAAQYQEMWSAPPATFIVVSCVINNSGAISQVYGDGTLRSSATGVPGISTSGALALGSRQVSLLSSGMVGDIAECCLFNRALATDEHLHISNAWRAKWGTA